MARKVKIAKPEIIHHLDEIVELRVLKVIQDGEGKRSNVYLIDCQRRQPKQSITALSDLSRCVLKTVSSRERPAPAFADLRSSHPMTSTKGFSRERLQHTRNCSDQPLQLTQKPPGQFYHHTTRSRPRGLFALASCNYQTPWNHSNLVEIGSDQVAMFCRRMEQSTAGVFS